jgi:murein DD-endopeptidase MepM/ murein hydrolase activator NlpD
MDRHRDRQADRGRAKMDLGVEPPIELDGEEHTQVDRWRVSFRWLVGTVLTGLAGALLIAAALYAALGSHSYFAESPAFAVISRRDGGSEQINGGKGDRLMKSVDLVAAKQSFRTSARITVGDREVLRMRGFTRIATPLTLVSTGFADDVPPFNPLKLLNDSRNPISAEAIDPGQRQDDAEVSFAIRDIAGLDLPAAALRLSAEEAQAQVTELLKSAFSSGNPLPITSQLLLTRTSRVGLDLAGGLGYATIGAGSLSAPFSNIEVRMVPENVTNLPKAGAEAKDSEERMVIIRKNETVEDVLRANGAGRDQIATIMRALKRATQAPVAEGQRLKLLLADVTGLGSGLQVARLSVYTDDKLEATVAIADDGGFVPVARSEEAPAPAARGKQSEDDDEEDGEGMRLYDSLYETALKSDIPKTVVSDLVRIFANDVDFQRAVSAGDSFEAFYEDGEEGEARNDLLFATITTRNETFRYYRFQTPDDGMVDFYDENGRSTRKFLVRKPITQGETRSGFGMRRHPILGYTRMHTGVDWAAPMGTPIFAAGNGTVIKAGRESGYGNRVEVQHANGYITTYNHLSGFARGLTEGQRVRQGQVVGYLGMTGLATGPHLHYEVIVNGHFVDPLRVKLARTRELDGRMIAAFKRERERIEDLIGKAPGAARVATRTGGN